MFIKSIPDEFGNLSMFYSLFLRREKSISSAQFFDFCYSSLQNLFSSLSCYYVRKESRIDE